ncbi:hypothetical protein AB205_0154390 [Aquarana catesbeiana]|uniref:Band 7 domain-containing protein n=1 Tax=Aquarana catesbeiana TaxID=8400 RepID=A0A2G9SG86_AQUCT|nr:hypothetical protein AB205_0154390 [Aquarana catesbeiana]
MGAHSEEEEQTVPAGDSRRGDAMKGGIGVCGWFLLIISAVFVVITFPLSIWFCVKIIKEYERAVVFRLGRITSGKPSGPGKDYPYIESETAVKTTCKILLKIT